MKNAIKYYYNLDIEKIYKEYNYFYFYLDDIKICIYKLERNINELPELVRVSNELFNNKIPVATFITTINNNFYYAYDEENYALLRINCYENDSIDIYDISNFNKMLVSKNKDILNNIPWNISFANTIDRIEEALKDFNKEYLNLQNNINYYIGLAENAIIYYDSVQSEVNIKHMYHISHKRINYNMQLQEFYNPLNFIFDFEIRDLASYMQSAFFNNKFDFDEFEKYINYKKYDRYLIELLYIRLLYPSYYFDITEKVILKEIDEKVLNLFHNKSLEYEDFLINIYCILKSKYNITNVEWIGSEIKNDDLI